jgi:hypothetical protein
MNKNVPTPFVDATMGFGPGGPLPVPSPWQTFGGYISYTGGGVVIGAPSGGSFGPGTVNALNLYINGLSVNPNNFLLLSGGTIGGSLTVNGAFILGSTIDGAVLDMGTF